MDSLVFGGFCQCRILFGVPFSRYLSNQRGDVSANDAVTLKVNDFDSWGLRDKLPNGLVFAGDGEIVEKLASDCPGSFMDLGFKS